MAQKTDNRSARSSLLADLLQKAAETAEIMLAKVICLC